MIYKAVEVIWIFFADTRTDTHTDRGVPRDPRGPKKDEGVIFQPFHRWINRGTSRCGDLETSADLPALIVFEPQHFP